MIKQMFLRLSDGRLYSKSEWILVMLDTFLKRNPNEPFSSLQAQQHGLHCANPSEQRIDFNASF